MTAEREQVGVVAWVIPGDDTADCNGYVDAMASQEGEFGRPLVCKADYDKLAAALVEARADRTQSDIDWQRHIREQIGLINTLRTQLAVARDSVVKLRTPSLANDGESREYIIGFKSGYTEARQDAVDAITAALAQEAL